jgi:hypothetical protein
MNKLVKSLEVNVMQKRIWKVINIILFSVSIIIWLLILNWFFTITPFQKLQGMPILITIFICPISIILGVISLKNTQHRIAKWGIVSNSILLILPFLYFILGTLIFGP